MNLTGIQTATIPAVSQTYLTAGTRLLAHFLAGISRKVTVIRALLIAFLIVPAASGATPAGQSTRSNAGWSHLSPSLSPLWTKNKLLVA